MSATELQSPPPEAPGDGLDLVLPGRRNPAGAGWDWIVGGWRLFTRAPLMWIVSLVLLFVVALVVSLVPILGQLAFQVLQTVFIAGYMVACRSLERGEEFELEHLLAGFKNHFMKLVIVGVVMLVGMLAIILAFVMIAGVSLLPAFLAGDAEYVGAALAASAGVMAIGTLVALALTVPLLAAYWFAPALVVLHGMAPVAAMKASFFACFRNFVPFLVYGLVMLVLGVVAMIPFGLGLLVLFPVAIASSYVAYRGIFTD